MNAGRPFSASPSHPSPGGLCSVQSTGQQVRDIFCADLSELLALLIVGDSNALLLDELASNTVSVGPHTHFGAEMADEQNSSPHRLTTKKSSPTTLTFSS